MRCDPRTRELMVFFGPVAHDRNHPAFDGAAGFTNSMAEVSCGRIEALSLVLRRGVVPPGARARIPFWTQKYAAIVELCVCVPYEEERRLGQCMSCVIAASQKPGVFVHPSCHARNAGNECADHAPPPLGTLGLTSDFKIPLHRTEHGADNSEEITARLAHVQISTPAG